MTFAESRSNTVPVQQDSDASVRRRAAQALGNLGSERAISGLLTALEHADPSVRWRAAQALGQIGNPHLLTLLKQNLWSARYDEPLQVLLTIQANCKFYNDEIW